MKLSKTNILLIAGVVAVAVLAAGSVLYGGRPFGGMAEAAAYKSAVNGQIQEITTELQPSGYPDLIVQKGIPVRWNLRASADALNSCNNAIVIPEYGIEKSLRPGDNIIEFTPAQSGVVPYSCWMGMIDGRISVVDDLASADSETLGKLNVIGAPGRAGGCCRALPASDGLAPK